MVQGPPGPAQQGPVWRGAGGALLALALAAAARAEPVLPPEVASLLARAKLPADALAAVVLETSPERAPLLAWRADAPVNPASTLKLVTISIPGRTTPKIDLLVVTPNAVRPAPVALCSTTALARPRPICTTS